MKRKVRNTEELYVSMAEAIRYIREHANDHPEAAAVAKHVSMSVSRFEHAFTEWVGTTPKRFLAHVVKEQAKTELARNSVLATAHASGLSGSSRLHDLFVTYEAVTPGEFKSGEIAISYGIHESPFGWCLLGITKRGICHLSFLESNDATAAPRLLKGSWPTARLEHNPDVTKPFIRKIFFPIRSTSRRPLHLLIKGTNFQIKVWEALLAIPQGTTSNYTAIATAAGSPKAVRAAGTACGKNKIAYLIPCHRVLTSNGGLGGYRWGVKRKEALLAWESIVQKNTV